MKRRPRTIIHVNQHVIRKNHQTGEREPVLTVKSGRGNRYAHRVQINGPSEVVYRPDKPLSCGARVWIETRAEVVLDPVDGLSVEEQAALEPGACLTQAVICAEPAPEPGVAARRHGKPRLGSG